jgi:uncharacterized protein YjiS (DUF1127 family)
VFALQIRKQNYRLIQPNQQWDRKNDAVLHLDDLDDDPPPLQFHNLLDHFESLDFALNQRTCCEEP